MTHRLKIHPEYFQSAKDGLKPWELRLNDRNFQIGDEVILEEWDPSPSDEPWGYTGRVITGTITYVLQDAFGMPEGYCIFTYKVHGV
jgi:hypothetical protein